MLTKGANLVIVSMLVFGVLNLIENLIHYNIGRSHKNSEFVFNIPDTNDFIKIFFTMIIFGLAQGLLTELFIKD
jgi:uncharacterized protein YsxB (DUF464 family)